MRVNLFFTSSYEGVFLKAKSSNKNTEYIPGGQIKPNVITVFDIFTSSYEGVYLKAESSNKNTEYMPGGQVKPKIIRSYFKGGK